MDRAYDSREPAISERETEIVELVARGLTNQEIAQVLTISKRTVDNHVSNISGGLAELGHGQRQDLSRWLQLLRHRHQPSLGIGPGRVA